MDVDRLSMFDTKIRQPKQAGPTRYGRPLHIATLRRRRLFQSPSKQKTREKTQSPKADMKRIPKYSLFVRAKGVCFNGVCRNNLREPASHMKVSQGKLGGSQESLKGWLVLQISRPWQKCQAARTRIATLDFLG